MGRRSNTTLGIAAAALAIAVGGWLALQRRDIPFAKLDAKYANPTSRFVYLPGGLRVHYRDQGNPAGPAIVMAHGFAASLHAWEPWVERLGADYRIITLDLPGHGLTRAAPSYVASLGRYATVIDQLAAALKLGPYVVVGSSMGGGAAWTLALQHPEYVRGLVLVDSIGVHGRRSGRGAPALFRILANPIGRRLIRDLDTRFLAAQGLKAAYLDRALVNRALVDRYVELSRAPGHRDILLSGQVPQDAQATAETFQAIRVPTLVLHGEADTLVPVSAGRALAAAIPGARLITYPHVGHVPMEQIPDRSADDVRGFMQALERFAPVNKARG